VTLGETVEEAVELAVSVEALCEIYLNAQRGGDPVVLTDTEMADVLARYETYGHQDRPRSHD
jgi:L-fuculose-phosphate aldolase